MKKSVREWRNESLINTSIQTRKIISEQKMLHLGKGWIITS